MMYQTYEGMDIEGTVLRIEKSSIFDGDGLRMDLVEKTGNLPIPSYLKDAHYAANGVQLRRVIKRKYRQRLMARSHTVRS